MRAFLLLSFLVFWIPCAATDPVRRGIVFGPASQAGSPAMLISTTHSTTDFLSRAELKNNSDQPIIAYRISWVEVSARGKTKGRSAPQIPVPAGIPPGAVTNVPGLGVWPQRIPPETCGAMFYVSEIKWLNGRSWKADRKEIEQQAKVMVRPACRLAVVKEEEEDQ